MHMQLPTSTAEAAGAAMSLMMGVSSSSISSLSGGSRYGCWSPSASEELHMRYQYISDFFIALAYFSIPLELIYFVKKSAVFPYRWVLVQFGAFIVLCGATHLINLWTFAAHSAAVSVVMTVAKILTAVVSCATALMLVHIIPDLLSVKTREQFLKNKAAELDREMGMMRTQEEAGRHVRMLTQEIRSSLDRHTILNTTLVELGKTLALEECALWMPTRDGLDLQLSHSLLLRQQDLVGSASAPPPPSVPLHHPTVKHALSSHRAVVVSPHSPLAVSRPSRGAKYMAGDVVAMRVPLLHLSSFQQHFAARPSSDAASAADLPKPPKRSAFALMVLMLPSDSARRWHLHELELVEVVAEQVAVALSHAAILEESIKTQEMLMDRNAALDMARREAETAVRARNNFLAVMDHEMRTPTHAITAFSSLLLDTNLTPDQRSMVDTILKSGNLLGTLINDVLDLSRLDDGSLQLDVRTFNLPMLFREIANLVKPIASVKKLSLSLHLDPDMPDYAVGDDKRLLQMTLNLMGNAIKFTKDGSVTLIACVERREYVQDPWTPEFRLVPGDDHFYLRVKVRDTGIGVNPADIPKLFSRASPCDSSGGRIYPSTGLGLPICKRFANLMDGHIWIESQGIGKGSVITFVVKLQYPERVLEVQGMEQQKVPLLMPKESMSRRTDFKGLKVLVVDDNMVNRMVTKGLLTRIGCDVTTVGSGREAVSLLLIGAASRRYRVLFVDVFMPEMDGYEVAMRVREHYSGRSSEGVGSNNKRPVMIAVTANTDVAVRERCFAVGVDGVLLKPFSLDKVRSLLNDLLDRGGLVL